MSAAVIVALALIAWWAGLLFAVAICQSAARADREAAQARKDATT